MGVSARCLPLCRLAALSAGTEFAPHPCPPRKGEGNQAGLSARLG